MHIKAPPAVATEKEAEEKKTQEELMMAAMMTDVVGKEKGDNSRGAHVVPPVSGA